MDNQQELRFDTGLLIYVPAYNCSDHIISVLDEIPADILAISEILIVDNRSTDDTVDKIQRARSDNRWDTAVHLIQPPENLGYAGSQKLAYSIALRSDKVKRVIMLHGDGQYPPELLENFMPLTDSDYGVVYGYRDKYEYPDLEETPGGAYRVIKILSAIESYVTGHPRKEWHSGFVMYSREFLLRVDLDELTDTYHIDGHLHFMAGELDEPVKAIPIWKRYKGYAPLTGWKRIRYLFDVLKLLIQFKLRRSFKSNFNSELELSRYLVLRSPTTVSTNTESTDN
jgi:glycosyltransferase involved in cell wall biosynthesis